MSDQLNEFAGISKRDFLQKIGMIGGSAALYTAMSGLEMVQASEYETPPELSTEGKGKKVIILGAGLAGLVTAMELRKKGYKCQIIEARDHSGGRCQSARKGKVIHEVGGERQVCGFEHNHYLNIGPWRIPAEHKAVIYYCRELGVELEPMINKSVHAYYYSENIDGPLKGKCVRQVEVDVDRAGNIQELLAKAVNSGALDENLTEEDKERLLEYMSRTGLLDRKELNYRANRARGHEKEAYPGVLMDGGKLSEPFALAELLKVKSGARWLTADHPAVMYQAKGGMDQIPFAMEKTLKRGTIKYNKEVINIQHSEDDVTVTTKDMKNGKIREEKADFVISTIPFSVLSNIENNFSADIKDALKGATSAPAFKIGLQFTRRFWEEDDTIYGGATFSDIENHYQTSYPSSNLFGKNGDVMLTNYKYGGGSVELSNMSIAERIEHSLMCGEKFHPGQFRKHYNGQAISKSWHRDRFALGGSSSFRSARQRRKNVPIVLKGEKRVIFSGGGMAPFHAAWMTGAIEAAWHMMTEFDKRVAQV
ncbi:flavin monoamine oxidase family protein [Pseudemcibacter aquimaris]|uniref:flavin monoamine oxidase family protein n=1 Tax=Pseudemcibacter aquimaris TaxID=2857064 RepID=UPI0020127BE9|nr:flavin monoamine oxidase family protein [Pseudemcibacter aquimaris]MCC3859905.1 FAD-dependent oxidoreductase [Pseudemcibacter aquimaris]WDU57237.1 FAD-dependent oxidoreductase [Pseudemcibacter aquimaris]